MANRIPRRQFLSATLAAATLPQLLNTEPTVAQTQSSSTDSIPIIDTHIHLFDPTRPQGVPWPNASNAVLYKPAVPARYRQVVAGLNVVGAIEVECSTWLEDNQWVLDVANADTIMVGTVGNLEPGKPEFPAQLERFARNPLFRGIRYGNLWSRNLGAELDKPEFVTDLKRLAAAGLELDSANPTPQLLADIVKTSDRVPELRIVLDHLPNLPRPPEGPARTMYDSAIKQLAQRPQIYFKVSEVLHRGPDGTVSLNLATYREKLDEMFDTFGPDRLLYGSDWPNSDPIATYPQVLAIVREYFLAKGREVAEKYFWKNSVAAYRWVKRDASQPAI